VDKVNDESYRSLPTVSNNAGDRAVQDICLKPLDCWIRGFEFCRRNGCWSLVLIVCCVGSGVCDGLITGTEKSYRGCVSN